MKIEWKEKFYQELEPGVREIVRSLHQYQVATCMSCEGHRRQCKTGGLFPHYMYIEILPYVYYQFEPQFKKLSRLLNDIDIRVIIDPTKRRKDRFFLVGQQDISNNFRVPQDEVVRAIHKVWGSK